jgi:hypothetical protein
MSKMEREGKEQGEPFVQQVVGHPKLVNNLSTNCHLEA